MMEDTVLSRSAWIDYMTEVSNKTSDLLLQFWRLDPDPIQHVKKLVTPYCGYAAGGNVVADFAGGTGQFMFSYAQLFPWTICLSINKYGPLSFNPNLYFPPSVTLLERDLSEPYEMEKELDFAFFNYAFGHFDDHIIVLDNIHGGLKMGGKLIMWDVTAASPLCQRLFGYKLRTLPEVIHALETRGFNVLKCEIVNAEVAESCKKIFSPEEVDMFRQYTLPFVLVAEAR